MRKTALILLIVLVLFSLGCQQRGDRTGPEVVEYHKGTMGLDVEIVKNLPPSEIIQGNDFVIALELRNKGAFDIESGKILVYGFEDGYISVENPYATFDIAGKKPGFPEGGYDVINFKARNIGIPEIIEEYNAPFTVRACYRYETEAGAEICINPDIYSYVKTKDIVCTPGKVELSGGQGAPVAMTKIEESFSPFGSKMKVDFLIYIQNKGDGEVVGGVYIEEVRLSNNRISCSTDFIDIKDKEEKSFLCTAETPISSGAYIAPISIKLVYDYASKIDKTVKIKTITAKS